MTDKNDHLEKAREHFRTRAARRPKQWWDAPTKQWLKDETPEEVMQMVGPRVIGG